MRRRRFLKRALNFLVTPEFIGQEECPLMVRWTLLDIGFLKAMIHYFPPEATDPDPHDHPRSFITCILRGGYFNTEWVKVDLPGQDYMEEIEWLPAGSIRYRPADHMHVTTTGRQGAWTVVVMGRLVRPWGFLREGFWWPWKRYVEIFDSPVRCEPVEPSHGGQRDPRDYKTSPPPWDALG